VLYDLIGFPQEISKDAFGLDITTVEDFDATSINLMKVLAKEVKYAPNYTKVSLEDSTGTLVLFAPKGMTIDEGKIILGYCTNKNLLGFVYYDEVKMKLDNKYPLDDIEKFMVYGELFTDERMLYNEGVGRLGEEKALVAPIFVRPFKTKAGKDMATAVISDEENVVEILFFPKAYSQYAAWLRPFNPIVIRTQLTKDGTLTIEDDGLITAEELMKRKGLK
jgi:hypothetical protein